MTEIKIQSVDIENIEKDNSFEMAYAFFVNLDKNPDGDWKHFFHENWNGMIFSGRQNVSLDGAKVRIIFGDGDNLQSHIDFLKKVIEATNNRHKEHTETQARIQAREEVKKAEIDKTKDRLKDNLKEVRL